jgi:dTDP-4-amino-4,6-dideoxygalactose transaminase
MHITHNINLKIAVQKIIKVSFLNLFFSYNFKKKKIIYKIQRLFKLKTKNLIFIGRARTSIFLIIKYFKKDSYRRIVIISPFTIPAIINLIIKAGGKPLFVDFEKGTTSLNFIDLKKIIKKFKPLALIITHYHVNEQNYKRICSYCKKNDVKIIEDCAISYSGNSNKTKINTLSDASFFSFSSFKAVNYYYGGAIYSKHISLIKYVQDTIKPWKKLTFFDYFEQVYKTQVYRLFTSKIIYNLLTHNLIKKRIFDKKKVKKKYFSNSLISKDYYKKPGDGFYREIDHKINNYKKIINHRRKIARLYYDSLNSISVLPKSFSKKDISENSFNFYLIRHKNSVDIRKHLIKKGYGIGKNYYENCRYMVKNSNKTLNLDVIIKELLILPTHFDITIDYAKKIIFEINYFIKNNK